MTRKIYLTDLSEAEWHRLSRLVPGPKPGGRPLKYLRRAILNAIFYLVRAGCAWRMLPKDLPPWQIVYHYFRIWTQSGWWQQLHDHLRGQVRVQEGRRPQPSAGILDFLVSDDAAHQTPERTAEDVSEKHYSLLFFRLSLTLFTFPKRRSWERPPVLRLWCLIKMPRSSDPPRRIEDVGDGKPNALVHRPRL